MPAAGVNMREAVAKGWVRPYHNATTDLSAYEGKRVLILGRGNAAFEFANAVLEVAASVTLLGRAAGRLRLAYETHYPVRGRGRSEGRRLARVLTSLPHHQGDIRAVHAHLLESYMLKSQDNIGALRCKCSLSVAYDGPILFPLIYAPRSLPPHHCSGGLP